MRLCAPVLLVAALFAPSAALAQAKIDINSTPAALEKIYACRTEADDKARLACFDAAVAALKIAQDQGQITAVDTAKVVQLEHEAFGFSLPTLQQLRLRSLHTSAGKSETTTSQIAATIVKLGERHGEQMFVLSNGQTWISIDSAENPNADVGAAITIRRAALGSYLMYAARGGVPVRVRREE